MKKVITIILMIVLTLMFTSCTRKEEKILEECPFELSENSIVEYYPSNNMFGLTAIAKDADQDSNFMILAFKESNKYIDEISKDNDPQGWGLNDLEKVYSIEFDEVKMTFSNKTLYVSLVYDNSINLSAVRFSDSLIGISENKLIHWGREKGRTKIDTQTYDEIHKWGKISTTYEYDKLIPN